MNRYKISTAVFATALLAACQSMPERQTPVQLNAEQVKAQFENKTVESFNLSTGVTSFTYYGTNGRLIQHRLWQVHNGKWNVNEDGAICLAIRSDEFSCRYVFDENGKLYKYREQEKGQMEKIIRYRQFIEGNAL